MTSQVSLTSRPTILLNSYSSKSNFTQGFKHTDSIYLSSIAHKLHNVYLFTTYVHCRSHARS